MLWRGVFRCGPRRQSKAADEFALGGIAMPSMLVPMLASIPLGRPADRHGRKNGDSQT